MKVRTTWALIAFLAILAPATLRDNLLPHRTPPPYTLAPSGLVIPPPDPVQNNPAQLIRDSEAAHTQGRTLTPRDQRRYSNAFIVAGLQCVDAGDVRGAAQRFRQAREIDPTNTLAAYNFGLLAKQHYLFVDAVAALREVAQQKGPLKDAANQQLREIVTWFNTQADSLIEQSRYTEAARCYEFLAAHFNGQVQQHASTQLQAMEDEVKAEGMLAEARRLFQMGRRNEAHKLLRQILTTLSWTHAAEMAKRIERNTDSLEVRVSSESPAGKYATREKWIDLETANCLVYYQNTEQAKAVAQRVEDTIQRVTEQLRYTGLDWHRDKCKVFVFDDVAAWIEFVRESGASLEWAAGFAYGPLREVYLHAGDPNAMLNRILPHELTHVIHREYAPEDATLPLWLLEGLACANEFTGKDERRSRVRGALARNRLIPLAKLTAMRNYPGQDEVKLYYAECLMLIEFIIDHYGLDGLERLHKALRKTDELDKLFKRAFKTAPEEFEVQWIEYIRTH